jgi:DNA repair protein RecO
MPLLNSEAFVLLRHPLTESSWIVTLFTREEGVVRAVAKGARRTTSPFRGALEPLSRVRVEVVLKEGRELGTLRSAELLEGSMDLHGRWPEAAVLMGMGETLERALPAHAAEEESYRLLGAVLAGLRAGAPPLLAWVYFSSWLLRLHGVFPRPEGCVTCGAQGYPLLLDLGAGEWRCPRCQRQRPAEGRALTGPMASLLEAVFRSPLASLSRREFPQEALSALSGMVYWALAAYLGRPLANWPALESLGGAAGP